MAGINIIRRWVMSQMTKKADDGIMITLPEKNKVDLNVSITMDRLLRNGIDPNQITSPQQVDNAINMINSRMVNRTIAADSPEGREITEKLFGKQKAPVFDMEGNRIPEGSGIMGGKSVKDLMKSGQVTKGASGITKSKKIQDREMFQAANKRLMSDVDSIIKNIKSMEPITAMKEAISVIARKGKYRNLTSEQSKKILQDTEDHIFERDIPETEDFAAGGIARTGFVGGGMGRRGFLKMLAGLGAGIGAAKTGILKFAGKEPAKQVAKEVVQKSTTTPPPYFFKLAEKIKKLGSDTTPTNDRTIAKSLKSKDGTADYILEEDVVTGDIQIKKVNMERDDMINDIEIMELRKGEVVKGPDGKPIRTPDEYDEVTESISRIYKDNFNDPDYSEGIRVKEVMEEVMDAPSIKKAGGGIARMLGE